ncbi:MAG: Bug family tripartite tricarboxylate transporter substrate binding protein [Burkholderiales bacterium]
MRPLLVAALLGALQFFPAAWAQQDYPTKPIRIIVPSVAGGGTDSSTRIVVARMSEALPGKIVVDNRPGAGSIIGTEMVARAAPDGYTLLAAISTITIQPSMQKSLPFDPQKDFAPVSVFVRLPNVLVGHPSLQPKNVKELIAFAKARPGKLEFASAGTGSNLHLSMEMFLYMAGLKMVHVPYKGASQAIADVTAGYVPFMITNMITGTTQFKAGKLHAYGVTSAKRSPAAPDIPTIAEQGVPGYEAVQWYGLMAPAGTPREIVARLNKSVVAALQDPKVKEQFIASGAEPVGNSPEEMAALVRSDMAKWGKVIKAAGLKAE